MYASENKTAMICTFPTDGPQISTKFDQKSYQNTSL